MVMQGQGVSNIAPRRRTRSAGERMALGIRSIDPVRNHGRCGGSLSPRNSGISCVGHHSTRSGGSAVSAQDVHLYLGRKLVARSRLSSRSVQPGRFLSGGAIFPRHDFNEGLFLVRGRFETYDRETSNITEGCSGQAATARHYSTRQATKKLALTQ